jgi:hypothetical protein
MTRSPFLLLIFAALLAATPAPAAAQRRNAPPPRPELFQALLRCRAITDEAERLRCFDSTAAALETAADRREVAMVDRAQVREGRRRLFGLSLPSIPLFGGGDDEGDEDRIETVEGVVASASQNGQGQWIVSLQDGAVWTQIDNRPLAVFPRRGQRVVIQRATMGSFMMRINNQPGVRARRIR